MSRNLLRSDYDAGEPAWAEWLAVAALLAIGVSGFLGGGSSTIPVLATAGGLGFGSFLVVVERGGLRTSESS